MVLPVRQLVKPVAYDPARTEPHAIRQHTCTHCGGGMVLAHVRPARIGFDMQTFEGVDCCHIDKIVVATDISPGSSETRSFEKTSGSGITRFPLNKN